MSEEPRARDVLRDLPPRRVVGDRLVSRVGARAFAPPRFAKGRKMFARCGVPDPWDPDAKDIPLELGDIGLAGRKLPPGADPSRRMPAPHASPPAQKAAPRPGLPPRAPQPGPASAPAGRPAPRIGDVRPDDTAKLRQGIVEKERRKVSEQSIEAARVRQPVKALPVRPDLAGAPGAGGGSSPVPVRPATAAPRPGAGPFRPPQRPDAPVGGAPRADSPRADAPRPDAPVGGAPRPDVPRPAARPGMPPRAALPPRSTLPPAPVELPMGPPDLDEPGGPGDLGFARGRPTAPSLPYPTPGGSDLPYPEPASPVGASAPLSPASSPLPSGSSSPGAPSPGAPPPRPSAGPPRPPGPASPSSPSPSSPASPGAPPSRAMPRPGGGNLDDLFGIGGGDNTRIRMGATEEARPRRPRVVDPSEAPGGVDRRPPPPKPPKVVASSPAPAAPRDEEPPE